MILLQFRKIFQCVENVIGHKINIVVRQVSEILNVRVRTMINKTFRRRIYSTNIIKLTHSSVRLVKFLNVSLWRDKIRLVLKSL